MKNIKNFRNFKINEDLDSPYIDHWGDFSHWLISNRFDSELVDDVAFYEKFDELYYNNFMDPSEKSVEIANYIVDNGFMTDYTPDWSDIVNYLDGLFSGKLTA